MTEVLLYAGDCIKILPEWVEPQCIDVCVTSPPYNLGVKYRKYSDKRKEIDYLNFTRQWLAAVHRVLKPNGSLFLNFGACPRMPLMPYKALLVAAETFILQNTFHWVKSISLDKKDGSVLSTGHFKPITSARYVNDCHEFIFHLTKTGSVTIDRLALGVPYVDKTNTKRWKKTGGQDRRCRGNLWFIPYPTIRSRIKQRPHPATFPPKLAEMAIRTHGGDLSALNVLDPFVGIGNSALGAMNVGVQSFYGIDNDEVYLDEANERVKAARL